MNKVNQMTAQIARDINLEDSVLKEVVQRTLERIYEPGLFYLKHQVVVIPQTAEQMLKHSKHSFSKIEWNQKCTPLKPEKIFLNTEAGNESVIWDLLHEFGHLIDGPPTEEPGNRPKDIERESRAWANGRSYLKGLPSFLEQYDSHTRMCLDTYRRNTIN